MTDFMSPPPGSRRRPVSIPRTTNIFNAASSNTSTTQKGKGGKRTSDQARIQDAMERLAGRSNRANAKDVRSTQNQAVNMFGTALGKVIAADLQTAGAAVRAGEATTAGAVAGGKKLVQGGKRAREELKEGLLQASIGAAHERAEIQQEASRDQALIAQEQANRLAEIQTSAANNLQEARSQLTADQRLQIAQMKLDRYYQLQDEKRAEELYRSHVRFEARVANGGSSSGFGTAAEQVTAMGTETTTVTNLDGTETTVPVYDDETLMNNVNALAIANNLGPKETERLRQQALTARGNAEAAPDEGATQAIASTAQTASAQASEGAVGPLTDSNILDYLGIEPRPDGTVIVNGQVFSGQWAAGAVAIFKQNYTGPLADSGAA